MSEQSEQAHRESVWQMEIREVFTLRLQDRALLEALQERLSSLYCWSTRSDMVRAALWQLTSLNDEELGHLLRSMGTAQEAKQTA
jgi:hypothetical protein